MRFDNIKLTIITACYNSEKYIEQTILSVINQSYINIEYIIIDGGSEDNTVNIINNYINNIDTFISEADNGVYDAFNKGIALANGQYIMFVNSDDYLISNEIIHELMNEIIVRNYPVGIYGDILMKNEETGFVSISGQEITLDHFRKGKMPPHPSTILLKSAIEEFNCFDNQYKIAADFNLMLHIFKEYKSSLYYIPKVISMFRLGGLSENKLVREETLKIIESHFDNPLYFKEVTNESYMKRLIENYLFQKKTLGSYLIKRGIKNVAIFGSGEWGVVISKDLSNMGIKTIIFLDNNPRRQGIRMNQVFVESPNWLLDKHNQVDAIIIGVQGNHIDEVKGQLNSLINDSEILIFDWRQIVDFL